MADDKRMNHDVMRRANEALHERAGTTEDVAPNESSREPIPGEIEPNTERPLSHPIGAELAASDPEETLDDATRRERKWEGGGRVR